MSRDQSRPSSTQTGCEYSSAKSKVCLWPGRINGVLAHPRRPVSLESPSQTSTPLSRGFCLVSAKRD